MKPGWGLDDGAAFVGAWVIAVGANLLALALDLAVLSLIRRQARG
jgi:hypothetical protein